MRKANAMEIQHLRRSRGHRVLRGGGEDLELRDAGCEERLHLGEGGVAQLDGHHRRPRWGKAPDHGPGINTPNVKKKQDSACSGG